MLVSVEVLVYLSSETVHEFVKDTWNGLKFVLRQSQFVAQPVGRTKVFGRNLSVLHIRTEHRDPEWV